jgi:hypothetical protein
MNKTINLTIANPIINNDKEVFNNKRDFINHCLMVLGHQQGLEVKLIDNSGTNVHVLFYTDRFGHERIWNASYKGEQHLWDEALEDAVRICNSLNNNRTYDTKWTLQDAIDQAIYPEYKRYWQDLLDTLVAQEVSA